MWNELTNQQEIDDFMDSLYHFHDSCLKELRYLSGAYVDEGLGMYPINSQRVLRVIVQRQFENPSALEIEFSGLKCMSLIPVEDRYTCEILDATMLLKDGYFYWCDQGGLSENELDDYDGTLICAKRVRWRRADEYLGDKEIYTSKQGSEADREEQEA